MDGGTKRENLTFYSISCHLPQPLFALYSKNGILLILFIRHRSRGPTLKGGKPKQPEKYQQTLKIRKRKLQKKMEGH